jgi:TetR/AcrR family transcriptional regulator, transcriptional repressor for nem operon
MREVMAASHLTQGGFYRHFASKGELVAEAYQLAIDHLFEMIEREAKDKPAAKALSTAINIYLSQYEDEENRLLCPLAMLGSELTHCDPKIRSNAIDWLTPLYNRSTPPLLPAAPYAIQKIHR